jgi:cupin fold WbuC family metalloprotein
MARYRTQSQEVLYTTESITFVGAADIAHFKELARQNPRKRVRLCTHPSETDALHEMLIVRGGGSYVQPHSHPGNSEAFHIIDGDLTVVIFNDDGSVAQRIPMGQSGSGRTFYYRLSLPLYHTVIVESDYAVFHEVTNGPFRLGETRFAAWAPGPNDDQETIFQYLHMIERQ